jgi:hypothetical protein
MRPMVAAACLLSTASCGSELLRTGRAPVIMVVTQIDAATGNDPGQFATPLLSDVQALVETQINGQTVTVPTIFNDLGRAQFSLEQKDQSGLLGAANPPVTSPLNAVTINRYRVVFKRSDGRNTPGVDVPFGFDGAVTATIAPGTAGQVIFDLVRHASKSEPPLRSLIGGGGQLFISTVAEVTFFGRDQNGNEVMATGMIDVVFGDFGDEE